MPKTCKISLPVSPVCKLSYIQYLSSGNLWLSKESADQPGQNRCHHHSRVATGLMDTAQLAHSSKQLVNPGMLL
uniref:Uncharacterized protein n=1 Tax=Anguilla anguilla TaxID=7936 RepID=A0A0E9QVG5_ANGAN